MLRWMPDTFGARDYESGSFNFLFPYAAATISREGTFDPCDFQLRQPASQHV